MKTTFSKALPVWIKGKGTEKNITALFVTKIGKGETQINLTASSIYRMFVNGSFVAYGPARASHGYFRIDRVDLTKYCTNEENFVAIEVAGYNVNSYYLLDQPAFLQAEILQNGAVVAKTAADGEFYCRLVTERLQKVQRYSFQRPFAEAWSVYRAYYNAYVTLPANPQVLAESAPLKYLERNVGFASLKESNCVQVVSTGTVEYKGEKTFDFNDRSLAKISDTLKGYTEKELEFGLTEDASHLHFFKNESEPRKANPIEKLSENKWLTAKFRCNLSGFIKLKVKVPCKTHLTLLFDELISENDINPWRMQDCCNVLDITFEAGEYTFISYEPYTLYGLKIVCREGMAEISQISMVEYSCNAEMKSYTGDNENLRKIWDAAIESYRQNAVDLYSDCPSRERAGWLCDSFWTGRVEKILTGRSVVEHNFLENYLLPDSFAYLPDGMFPMCYPADHNDGFFIPNWSMWLVLELREYLDRSGDHEMIEAFRPKVYKLLSYLDTFLNEDGLLENLPGWVFVEWSKANDLVQDVNYPSNMLYAACLDACAELYDDNALAERAKDMREKILKQSFNGEFFVDNAVRVEGKLVLSGEITEVCQYYAFYFNIATPESHTLLWERLLHDFGPERKQNNKFPNVYFANAFIGNYMRLDLLFRYGYKELVFNNIEGYFLKMAEATGTLWEHDETYASLCHAFASHVICWLDA